MKTFAVDENNDFYVDKAGNFPILSSKQAVAQVSRHYAATKFEEMIHQFDLGIPFFETSFDHFPNMVQFEVALRKRLMEIPNVQSVSRVDVDFTDSTLSYVAVLQTDFGEVPINGRL